MITLLLTVATALALTHQGNRDATTSVVGSVAFASLSSDNGSVQLNPVGEVEIAVHAVLPDGTVRVLGNAYTAVDGRFALDVTVPLDAQELHVEAISANPDLVVGRRELGSFMAYRLRSAARPVNAGVARVRPFQIVSHNEGMRPEFSAFEVFEAARKFIHHVSAMGVGTPFHRQVVIRLGSETLFSPHRDEIVLAAEDGRDWDVIYHELAHVLQHRLGLAESPGGEHFGQDLCRVPADPAGNPHGWSDEDWATRLAWSEGWATFFGLAVQRELNLASLDIQDVGDEYYDDFTPATLRRDVSDNLEERPAVREPVAVGEGSEVAIARVLWNLHYQEMDGPDHLNVEALSDHLMRLHAIAQPGNPVERFADYWDDFLGAHDISLKVRLSSVAAQHGLGVILNSPPDSAEVAGSIRFVWEGRDCGQGGWGGNRYRVHIWTDSFDRQVWISDPSPSLFRAISDADLATFKVAPDEDLLWFVETHNRALPRPRTYFSSARHIRIVK